MGLRHASIQVPWWCVKKLGREYRDKVELALAWKCVQGEVEQGTLGGDFDRTERAEVLSLSASHGHTLRLVGTIPSSMEPSGDKGAAQTPHGERPAGER